MKFTQNLYALLIILASLFALAVIAARPFIVALQALVDAPARMASVEHSPKSPPENWSH
jgi:hypothetical protein